MEQTHHLHSQASTPHIFSRILISLNAEIYHNIMSILYTLTLPSNILVNMTIVGIFPSQIIRQKSSIEFSVGPNRSNTNDNQMHLIDSYLVIQYRHSFSHDPIQLGKEIKF